MSARCQRSHSVPQVLGRALRRRAVPAHVARRDGAVRLGFLRRHHRHRRRLRRSPELRHGHHGPPARGAGLPRRHHRAAGLAERRALQAVRPPEPVLRHHRRQHGFDGEPLHLGQADPQRRRLHARRHGRQAPGSQRGGVRAACARGVQGRAHRHRRHRGLAAPHRALRLLEREGAALGAARRQGGSAGVRQRRAADRRDRASPGRRLEDLRHHRPARHRVRAQVA